MAKRISVKRTEAGSSLGDRNTFEAIFDESPTDQDIWDAQVAAGYHPHGYGGPLSPSRVQLADGTWKSVFQCWGSCD